MPAPRIQLKRAVAALLPVALLWVFAACMLICGAERAAHGRPDVVPTVEATVTANAAECEGCPDASLLKATAPERVTFKPGLQALSSAPAFILPAAPSAAAAASAFSHRRQFLPDPPLELLPALRI